MVWSVRSLIHSNYKRRLVSQNMRHARIIDMIILICCFCSKLNDQSLKRQVCFVFSLCPQTCSQPLGEKYWDFFKFYIYNPAYRLHQSNCPIGIRIAPISCICVCIFHWSDHSIALGYTWWSKDVFLHVNHVMAKCCTELNPHVCT